MPGPGGPRGRASFLTEEEKQNSPRITKALVKRVLSYLRPYRKHLALVLCCIRYTEKGGRSGGQKPAGEKS